MKTLYQLKATGSLMSFSGTKSIFSRKIFNSKKEAENYIPEFKEKVTTGTEGVFDLDPKGLEITIVELEL